jgi:drug/metabolite transporter (DMT)-like permease
LPFGYNSTQIIEPTWLERIQNAMDRRKALFFLLTTVLLWSTSGLFVKILDWHPLAVSGIRSAIAALVIWSYLRRPHFVWSTTLIGGAIAYVGAQTLFVSATTLTSAANAIFLQYTAPVWVALFGIWYLGERARAIDWWTMGIIFVGMALFFGDELSAEGLQGNILAIIGGIAFAWMILFMRKQKDGSPETIALLGNILCALVGLPVVAMAWIDGTLPGTPSWVILLYLGVLQLGIPYLLYARSIRHLHAMEAVLIQTLEPILNPIWVFLIIDERPGPWSLAGAGVVLVAVTVRALIVAQGARTPRSLPEPVT